MGERIWTPQQRSAIDAAGGTLLVSAAAGSGKTAVLVQRVIEKLTSDDPEKYCDADRLLIVTFTRAAAAEMKERITAELQKKVEQDPWDARMRRQMILVKKASICTIDSFCSKLVRDNFYKLDIAPDFRIADDSELKIIREDCINEVLERNYAEGDDDFFELVEQLIGDKNDNELSDLIKKLDFYIGSFPFPEDIMTTLENAYSADNPTETVWGQSVLEFVKKATEYGLACNAIACDVSASDEKLTEKYLPSFERDAEILQGIQKAAVSHHWDDLYRYSSEAEITPLGRTTKLPYEADIAKAARKVVEEVMEEIHVAIVSDEEGFAKEISFTGRMVRELMGLLREYYASMAEAKARRRILDFVDLEHMAVNLLVQRKNDLQGSPKSSSSDYLNAYCKTDTALALTQQYDEIMLDEYQDTNAVQSLIFSAVARNPENADPRALTDGINMFMVGDMKQSIYRFRKAVPELFMEKFSRYTPFTAEDTKYPALITLGANFRSRYEVTEAINFIFRRIMSPEMGGVSYDESQELIARAIYPASDEMTAELHFLSRPKGHELNTADFEADYIASLIAKMLSEGFKVTDKRTGELRPARCGDFCILRRGISTHGRSYADALERKGIPSWISTDGGLLDTDEANVILSFLRVISNPLLDIPLMCVMMSPIFGFSPDEMAQIRLKERSAPLYGAVMSMAKDGDVKCAAFLESMEQYRLLAATQPADRLMEEICYSTGYLAAVGAMPNGDIRMANIRLLCEFAAKCEGSGTFGVGAFISTVDRMLEQGEDLPCAVSVTENSDVVRIMTIHKSKGLEFPVCIVAGLGTLFQKDGKGGEVITHNDLGIGMKMKEDGAWYETQIRRAIIERSNSENLSEEMRILYVALTRAKEKLIMVATPASVKSCINNAAIAVYNADENGQIPPFAMSQGNSFAAWLAMAAIQHPDCECLREVSTICVKPVPAPDCRLKAVIYDVDCEAEEEVNPETETEEKTATDDSQPDEALMSAIKERLSFQYPYEKLSGVPTKVTASELTKREHSGDSINLVRPSFMMSGGLTPTERGKALHKYMEFANFRAASESPEQELKRLQKYGFLTETEANAVDTSKITAFFEQMKPMLSEAEEILREREFSVILDREHTSVVTDSDIGDEPIVLEGECDCVLVYSDGAVILDYKTDRISDPDKLTEHYGTQLRLYRYAMELVLEKPVKGIYLYSFYLDKLIEVK